MLIMMIIMVTIVIELDSVHIEIRSISQDLLASWPTKEHHYQHQEQQESEQSEQKEQIFNIDKDIDEKKNKNKNTNNKEENWLEW
jgi:predicted Holliday junction resolvase-like endonuclease